MFNLYCIGQVVLFLGIVLVERLFIIFSLEENKIGFLQHFLKGNIAGIKISYHVKIDRVYLKSFY